MHVYMHVFKKKCIFKMHVKMQIKMHVKMFFLNAGKKYISNSTGGHGNEYKTKD